VQTRDITTIKGRYEKPKWCIRYIEIIGPKEKPRFPPTEKMDIPVTLFAPVKKWAVL